MNHEFADKIIKAKQLEMEAIGCLLPEPVKGHIDVINWELKDMAKEMAKEIIFGCCTNSEKPGVQEKEHKAEKIDIE